MFLLKVSLNLITCRQRAGTSSLLLNYLQFSKLTLCNVRGHFVSRAFYASEIGTSENDRPVPFETNYFENIIETSSKYSACTFREDPSRTLNKNSTNGLVLILRSLAREEDCNANDIPALENFDTDLFTVDDVIEICYCLSIPHVWSRLTYEKKKLWDFLTRKYKLDHPKVGDDLNKPVILSHLLSKTDFRSTNLFFYVIKSLQKKRKLLSDTQIIVILYALRFCKYQLSTKETKYKFHEMLAGKICNFSLDETALIAYCLLKKEINPTSILFRAITDRIESDIASWNDVQASIYFKFLRFCRRHNTGQIEGMLNKCLPILEKFSLVTSLDICSSGIYNDDNPKLVTGVVERATREISTVWLKNIERLLMICLRSNIHLSQESDFIKEIVRDLENRKDEIMKRQRVFMNLLRCLIMYDIYLEDHINSVLSEETIQSFPTVSQKTKMHELLFIDASVKIERPSYKGNELPQILRRKITRRLAAIVNAGSEKSTFKCAVRMTSMLENIYGQNKCTMARLFPHYGTWHPTVCFNQNNEQQNLDGKLNQHEGTVITAPKDGNRWACFVITGGQGYLSDGITPNLITKAKLRQFKAAGFTPIMVNLLEWKKKSDEMKNIYLREALECVWNNGCANRESLDSRVRQDVIETAKLEKSS